MINVSSESFCAGPLGVAAFAVGFAWQCAETLLEPIAVDPVGPFEYLKFFAMTLALELPMYHRLLPLMSFKRKAAAALVVNVATHPLIFFVFPLLLKSLGGTYFQYLVAAEVFAPVAEALVLWKAFGVGFKRAGTAALIANLFSWGIGALLF